MVHHSFHICIDHSLTEFRSWLENSIQNEAVFILMDNHTYEYCFPVLTKISSTIANSHQIVIPSGELHKNLKSLTQILETFVSKNAGRKSLLISLGGGVICDIGGFAASIYKRGIRSVLVPTTLLAQVDAAIGGKTGIDFMNHKNLVGSFSIPEKVFISKKFLETLPEQEKMNGIAEALKHGLIANREYWEKIKNDPLKDPDELLEISVAIKTAIVEKDPYEKNIRKILNAGHTVGHAIETAFLGLDQPVAHGQAVAAGLMVELYISNKKGYLSTEEMDQSVNIIENKFPKLPLEKFTPEELIGFMQQDKKNSGGKISFSLIRKIGEATWDDYVGEDIIRSGIQYYIHR